MELVLNINNKNVTVNVPTDEMLLDTLRNLGYYSVRFGLSAADDRQQADHAHQKCSNSLFHCIPPVIS